MVFLEENERNELGKIVFRLLEKKGEKMGEENEEGKKRN